MLPMDHWTTEDRNFIILGQDTLIQVLCEELEATRRERDEALTMIRDHFSRYISDRVAHEMAENEVAIESEEVREL